MQISKKAACWSYLEFGGNNCADAEVTLWCYTGLYITETKIRVSLHAFNCIDATALKYFLYI